MLFRKIKIAFLFMFLFSGINTLSAQYNVPNLQDLIGDKGSTVESQMERRNYEFVNTTKSRSQVYENWWHKIAGKCVTLRFTDGYLRSAIYAPDYDCHKEGNNSNAFGIYGIVNKKASYADQELERMGYRYINTTSSGRDDYANWWNAKKRKCITVRLNNGVVKSVVPSTKYDCEEHDNYYKGKKQYNNEIQYEREYGNHVNVNDLQGWHAVEAYGELGARGFHEVKKHTANGKTYRVWYNNNTGQCIKTVSVNKRIKEIMKSTHCW